MTITDLVRLAIAAYDANRFDEVVALARKGLALEADEPLLLQLLGAAQCQLGDWGAAQAALEQASLIAPMHPAARLALADCYRQAGKLDLACAIYAFLARTTTSIGLLAGVAARFGACKRYRAALRTCRGILRLAPEHHPAHFGVAYYLSLLGANGRKLLPHLATAVELAPDVVQYRLNLGWAWYQLGNVRAARAALLSVDLPALRCPCWLQRLEAIFTVARDSARAAACRQALLAIDADLELE